MTGDGQKQTKDKILDAAERLFAEHGFAETTLRSITSEAGVNLAAVNYHFGSKDALVEAVFARRLEPLNRERLRLLDEVEAAGGERLSLDGILEAFIGPPLRLHRDPRHGGPVFMKLMGRVLTDPGTRVQEIFTSQFRSILDRFAAALSHSLPELSSEEILWRMFFAVGAMAHTLGHTDKLETLSRGACRADDTEATVNRLRSFLAAGMRSPAPTVTRGSQP